MITYFYRFEFQSRGTLHLHMLVWVKDLALIRAGLLRASIPWDNRNDAFLVADTQKSSSSCLPVFQGPDSIEQGDDGATNLRFHYTPEDAHINLRAFTTTLLGALRCRTDMQVADGRGMLLKYVSSYVTKMHEAATSEGLYCTDLTGFQAANSFLCTVRRDDTLFLENKAQIDRNNFGTMLFMSKQVSLPKISSILQKNEN